MALTSIKQKEVYHTRKQQKQAVMDGQGGGGYIGKKGIHFLYQSICRVCLTIDNVCFQFESKAVAKCFCLEQPRIAKHNLLARSMRYPIT